MCGFLPPVLLPNVFFWCVARIHTALVIDLKVIQKPELKTTQLFASFITLLLSIQITLIGHTVDVILFHCHPTKHSSECQNLQSIANRMLLNRFVDIANQETSYAWGASAPVMIVLTPPEFPDIEFQGVPHSVVEALEYGIASRLPRRTTIMIKLGAELPEDIFDAQYLTHAGGNHICYSNILAEAELHAARERQKEMLLRAPTCAHHSPQSGNDKVKLPLSPLWPKLNTTNKNPVSQALVEGKEFHHKGNDSKALNATESKKPISQHGMINNRNGTNVTTTTSFTERKKQTRWLENQQIETEIPKEMNPLTRIEFLSELVLLLGLLKRIRMRVEVLPRVTSQTAYEAASSLQRGLNNRIACYSFYDY